MEEKKKITELKVLQLNSLLNAYGTPVTGNKAKKVAELIKILGCDEISTGDLEEATAENEITELKLIMRQMSGAIAKLTESVQELKTQTPQAETDNSFSQAEEGPDDALEEEGSVGTAEQGAEAQAEVIAGLHNANAQPRRTASYSRDYNAREVIDALPEFDPLSNSISSLQFIEKTKQLQRAYSWSEDITVFAVQQRMRGVARDWINGQPVYTTFRDFERAFLQDFTSVGNAAECHKEMMKKKRPLNGSYVRFYYEMLAIGRRGGLDDSSIITHVIDGLNDVQLARTLSAMDIDNCSN